MGPRFSPFPHSLSILSYSLLAIFSSGVGQAVQIEFTQNLQLSVGGRGSLGDADGDGHVDLFLLEDDEVLIYFGDGDGNLGNPQSIPFFGLLRTIATGDFNEDGYTDFLLGGFTRAVSYYFSTGPATYADPVVDFLDASGAPEVIEIADVNGDLHLDVVIAAGDPNGCAFDGFPDGSLNTLLGDGAGGLTQVQATDEVFCRIDAMGVGDFDEDGALDLVMSDVEDQQNVYLYLGNGSGQFGSRTLLTPPGSTPFDLVVGHFNADSHLDFVLAEFMGLRLYAGEGDGSFQVEDLETGSSYNSLERADFDLDGFQDLVTRGLSPSIYPGSGSGLGSAVPFGVNCGCSGFQVADMNEDGRPDLVATGPVTVFLNTTDLPLLDALAGNVNEGAGSITPVLFVNGSPGDLPFRRVAVPLGGALEIRIDAPPSMSPGTANFAAYIWPVAPEEGTVKALPSSVGSTVLPTPISSGCLPQPHPRGRMNNLGHVPLLGSESWAGPATTPAPYLASVPNGPTTPVTITIQGLILDSGSLHGAVATTNAVVVEIGGS